MTLRTSIPLRQLLAVILLCVALPLSALAQTVEPPDYAEWQTTAERAEDAIEAGRASNSALEALRTQVADWREQFLAAQDANRDRIATLTSQIEALGPVPESGEEPEDIAARRAELNTQLDRLRTPIVTAEEAYTRADGLIREIDQIIRDRQTERLLQLGPSPLNPTHWTGGIEALLGSLSALNAEARIQLANPVQQLELRQNIAVLAFYLIVALVLILRGRRWTERVGARLSQTQRRGAPVWAFLVSLGQIAVPLAGFFALREAIFASGMVGLRWTNIVDNLPTWALIVLVARWLVGRLYPKSIPEGALVLPPERRSEARWYVAFLAYIVVAEGLLSAIAAFDDYDAAALAVLRFPLQLAACLMLFRLGQILRQRAAMVGDEGERIPAAGVVSILGRTAMLVSVVGPLAALAGYGAASNALVFPTLLTMALFGAVRVLQMLVTDIWLALRDHEGARDSLVPVLIGFLIAVLAMPVLALIWGARVADLTELWTRFQAGFTFGDTRISPSDFLAFAVVFTIGYLATRLTQGALRNTVLPKTKIDVGGQNAIVSGVGYTGIFLAAIIAISSAGLDLSSLAIVAGALSVGIGFGLQNIVSNFVSGIILLIERPISEGDWIEVGGQMGFVRDISVRSTRIETFDRTDLIVPNADLVSGVVTNWTRGNSIGRVILPVGVAYGTDTRKVADILLKIARENDYVLLNPAPSVVFQGFGADSLDFEIRAILSDVAQGLNVRTEINHRIAEVFEKEGIEIPFAQRDVWLRNPEVLPGAASAAAPAKTPPPAPEGEGGAA